MIILLLNVLCKLIGKCPSCLHYFTLYLEEYMSIEVLLKGMFEKELEIIKQ